MSTGLFSDEEDGYNLEEETKYKLKLDAPNSEPAFGDSSDDDLSDFEDLGDEGDFGDEGNDDKPFNDEPFDAGVEADEDEDPEKYIQQLSGKLGTTLRKYTEDKGEPDFELEKFAINSVISATNTSEMDEEDKKDIIKKINTSGNDDSMDLGDKDDLDVDSEEPSEDDFGDEGMEESYEASPSNLKIYGPRGGKELSGKATEIPNNLKMYHKNPNSEKYQKEGDNNFTIDELLGENDDPCQKGYKQIGMKTKDGKEVPNCVPVSENINEAEYQGKEVELGKVTYVKKEKGKKKSNKKFQVYVKNDKGNIVKVTFGDKNMEIKRDDPERRKSFRARHKCDNPGPRWKARYWSCKMWSSKSVSDILSENNLNNSNKNTIFKENFDMVEYIKNKVAEMIETEDSPKVKPLEEVKPSRSPRRETVWKTKPSVTPPSKASR